MMKWYVIHTQTGVEEKAKAGLEGRMNTTDLKNYIGEEVRLQTTSGQTRQGFLTKIGSKVAHVEQRVHRGKFTMPVSLVSITKAEVLLTRPVK